jgi:hypothetical protein
VEALTRLFPEVTGDRFALAAHYPETGEEALERAGRTARLSQEFDGDILIGARGVGGGRGAAWSAARSSARALLPGEARSAEDHWVMEFRAMSALASDRSAVQRWARTRRSGPSSAGLTSRGPLNNEP